MKKKYEYIGYIKDIKAEIYDSEDFMSRPIRIDELTIISYSEDYPWVKDINFKTNEIEMNFLPNSSYSNGTEYKPKKYKIILEELDND